MANNSIASNSIARKWVPLRVAIARIVTRDLAFAESVRAVTAFDEPGADRIFNEPAVLAGCLADEMVTARCILSPHGGLGPRLAMVATPPYQRFKFLTREVEQHLRTEVAPDGAQIAGFETSIPERNNEEKEIKTAWIERRRSGGRVFKFMELSNYLCRRCQDTAVDLLKKIAKGEVEATAVPVELDLKTRKIKREYPPAGLSDSEVAALIETIFLGDDGLVHQSLNSVYAWKLSVFMDSGVEEEGEVGHPTPKAEPTDLSSKRSRIVGRPREKQDRVVSQMINDVTRGRLTRVELHEMKQEAMAKQYDASRPTCVQARVRALAVLQENAEK